MNRRRDFDEPDDLEIVSGPDLVRRTPDPQPRWRSCPVDETDRGLFSSRPARTSCTCGTGAGKRAELISVVLTRLEFRAES
jgi:hypothetical protein